MKTTAVAVLDVGKTNKKIRIYDRGFAVIEEARTSLDPKEHNGIEIDAVDELLAWFLRTVKELSARYEISAIGITTHGATCALLDETGCLAHPVISYTFSGGAEIQDEFYATFGDRRALHKETSTADFGFANVGKILYYVKSRLPEVWARTRHVLFLDSYLSYALTGKMASETSYLGNHTYLWRFKEGEWSSVAKALGADRLFPATTLKPWDALGTVKPEISEQCGLSENCLVACGIHDSNANFLPYLAIGQRDFILNSTGTWCVAMKQAAAQELTDAEIDAKLFFNMDATGKPVLTALFPGGMEYDKFRGFTSMKDKSDIEDIEHVIAARELFVIPGALADAKVFPSAEPKVVHKRQVYALDELELGAAPIEAFGQAYNAALNLGLAIGSQEMMRRIGAGKGTTVIIEGGFANNRPYCQALASLCPDLVISLTNMKEGTSFGAALIAWMAADNRTLEDMGKEFSIRMTPVSAEIKGPLERYAAAWRKNLRS